MGPADLTKFVEEAKGPPKTYICTICKHSSLKKENAKLHVESKHFKGLFHYNCFACNEDFPTLKALRIHKNNKHVKSNPVIPENTENNSHNLDKKEPVMEIIEREVIEETDENN